MCETRRRLAIWGHTVAPPAVPHAMKLLIIGLILVMLYICTFQTYVGELLQQLFLMKNNTKTPAAPDQWSQSQFNEWRDWAMTQHSTALKSSAITCISIFFVVLFEFCDLAQSKSEDTAEQAKDSASTLLLIAMAMCIKYTSVWPIIIICVFLKYNVFAKKPMMEALKTIIFGLAISLTIIYLNIGFISVLQMRRHITEEKCGEAKDNCAFLHALERDSRLSNFNVLLDNETYTISAFGRTAFFITKEMLKQDPSKFKAMIVDKAISHVYPILEAPLICAVYACTLTLLLVIATLSVHYSSRVKQCFWKSGLLPYIWMALLALAITECVSFFLRWHINSAYLRTVTEFATYVDKKALIDYVLAEKDLWAVSTWLTEKLAATRPPLRDIVAAIEAA